jgi:uncharacterized protein YwgA
MKPQGWSSVCDGMASNRPATIGSFLSMVWYGVIRRRIRPGFGAGVERSYRLPLPREQIALVMLALAKGETFTPVQIQKALFLADDKAGGAFSSRYEFKPYDYGPFDRRVYSDIEELANHGWAQINQQPGARWRTYSASEIGIELGQRYAERLGDEERSVLEKIAKLVRSLSFNELVSAIYKAYPSMRTRSVFRED